MTIETLTAQVLDLTNQTAALLVKVHAQAEYVRSVAASAVNATQSSVVRTVKNVEAIGIGQTLDVPMTTVSNEFSSPVTVVYSVGTVSISAQAYEVRFFLRSALGVDTLAHGILSATGGFQYVTPFTIVKALDTDTVIMKVTNLSNGVFTGLAVTTLSMDIEPSLVNVMKSPILTLEHVLTPVSAGTSREINLVVPLFQFSTLDTVVFAVSITSTTATPYSVELFTRGTSMIEKPVYQTASIVGNMKDAIPFTVAKDNVLDEMVMRVVNGSVVDSLSGWKIKFLTVGV